MDLPIYISPQLPLVWDAFMKAVVEKTVD